MGPVVGLIVNPSASRDIRRLTSLARTVDVYERVNQVARILQGLSACAHLHPGGLGPVRYMPEACRVVERAYAEIAHAGLDAPAPDPRPGPATAFDVGIFRRLVVEAVLPPGSGTADDANGTARAAAALARAGARCVVTLGGDGTNRAVARGWPGAVLCAVPGGTNNAFAPPLDPVTAGLAAGLFAIDPEGAAGHAHPCPRLDVRAGEAARTFALVDVAVVRGAWVGAHAVWDAETLVEVVVTRADPTVSGLGPGWRVEPPPLLRRTIGDRLLASVQATAQLTITAEADLTDLLAAGEAATLRTGRPHGVLCATIRAVAIALRDHPALTAAWVAGGLAVPDRIDVGCAVALADGLVVPVLRDPASRTIAEIEAEVADLAARAREGRLAPSETSGACFSVTNLGAHRIDAFTPLLNPPQTAILGLGQARLRPAVVGGAIVPRRLAVLSLTFDHRVVDGKPAAAFLDALLGLLEAPERVLGEGA